MNNFKSFNQFIEEQHNKPINSADSNLNPPREIGVKPISITRKTTSSKSQKKHKKRQKAFFRHPVLLVLAVIIIFTIFVLFLLPVPLGYIVLKGSEVLTVDDILFDGQIRRPVNVLQISTSELEERLSHDIRIDSVRVSRKFPFVLEVDVQDRIPIAIVQGEFGYALLDKNGFVMDTVQSIKTINVPMITGKRFGNLLLEERISDGDINEALNFLNHLSPEGIKVFSEVNIGNPENINAYTREGITVRLGDGEHMEERARLAEDMVGDVKARELSVEYLDANPASALIKLKK